MQQTSRRSLARTLSIAAAACVVVLLVGSLLWVTTLARLDKQTAAHPPAAQHTQSVLPTGIYMSSDQGVFRLDTRTHRVLWQRSLPHAAKIVPAGNVVYVLQSSQFGTSNAVAALDASSGKILWTHNIAQSSNKIGYATDLLFANGRLYVGWFASSTKSVTNGVLQGARTSGQIYVFDAANGRQRAVYAASAGVNSLVAADGLLVAGTDSELQTYNLADGTSQWHVPFTLGMHVLSMNIVEGRLYAVLSNNNDVAGEGQSSIVAYQLRGAQAGHQVWQSPKFPGDALYHFTVDRNIIYFGTFKSGAGAQSSFLTGKVYAYDLQSNHQLWSRPVNGGVQTAPVVSDGVVYVSADDGPDGHHALILALSATTGAVKWQQKLANDQADDFCVSNGVIYVIGMSYVSRGGVKPVPGTLYALNAADGSQLWQDRQQGTPNLVVPTA